MRMPKKEIIAYMRWVVNSFPCQKCGNMAQDAHHCLYGAYKDDRYLVALCRSCHQWAHANKKEGQALLMGIAEDNHKTYTKEKEC